MRQLTLLLISLWARSCRSTCPNFKDYPSLPHCSGMTDYQLCLNGIDPNYEDIDDSDYGETPMNCKMRTSAIREHILYWGNPGNEDEDCKMGGVYYKTCNKEFGPLACAKAGLACQIECFNGGVLIDPMSDQCYCQCPPGWAGPTCEECAMPCQHNGTVIQKGTDCWCHCSPPWGGSFCELCSRECHNGGYLDSYWDRTGDARCQCHCLKPYHGDNCEHCDLGCKHGGKPMDKTCGCICPEGTSGAMCEKCRKTCKNGGILDKDTCTCNCPPTRKGAFCEECVELECENGAFFNHETCKCDCHGGWSGKFCHKCEVSCGHRGTLQPDSCLCECQGLWKGPTCEVCPIKCHNGGELDNQKCGCKCKASKCRNGATANPDCSCACAPGWTGEYCHEPVSVAAKQQL